MIIDDFLLMSAGLLAALGALAGLLAGMFGIGGGMVLVPGLYYIFSHLGYDSAAMHMAVGTSLLTIVFTGAASAYAHYKRGAVDFDIFKKFGIGLVLGVALGTVMADRFDVDILKGIFAVTQLLFGSYMLLRQDKPVLCDALPRQPWTTIIATINTALATLRGVGGGVQNVLIMTMCNVPIHRATATASALGAVAATMGAAGFVWIGGDAMNLPPHTLGYINGPAFACIIFTSVACAPLCVKLAHDLPVKKLRKAFSIFILLVSAKMLAELI